MSEIWFSRVEGISTSYDVISSCSECGSLVLDRNEAGHRVWHDAEPERHFSFGATNTVRDDQIVELQREARDDNDA